MDDFHPVQPQDIDEAAQVLEASVLDDLPQFGWDNVTCARVLMNLSARLERMADQLVDHGPFPLVPIR